MCIYYNLMPIIEIKADTDFSPYFQELVDIVRLFGIEDRVTFICDTNANAVSLRALSSLVTIEVLGTGSIADLNFCLNLKNCRVLVNATNVTQEMVSTFHSNGVPVSVWGISNMTILQKILDLGVFVWVSVLSAPVSVKVMPYPRLVKPSVVSPKARVLLLLP